MQCHWIWHHVIDLSICLSITRRYSTKMVIRIFRLFSSSGSKTILVFTYQTGWQYSDRDTHNGGVKYKGYEKITIFHQYLALFWKSCKIELANGTSLNDFEWPVTQISRSRYYSMPNNSKKGTRWSYIDNGGPIESCMWSIERRHFQWPWTTPNPVFKVTLFFDVRKRLKTWP